MDAKWIGLLAAAVAAAAGFAGGVYSDHYATKRAVRLERLENLTALRASTYLDFFRAQAKLQQYRQRGALEPFGGDRTGGEPQAEPDGSRPADRLQDLRWQYELETKEARMKMAAFAPAALVEAMAEYFLALGPLPPCDSVWDRDVRIYTEMRREILAGLESDEVEPAKMYLLMWNCRPPTLTAGPAPEESRSGR